MKNRTTILNSVLAAVLGVVLLVSILVKANCPHFILPEINIPYIAAVSLTALVLTYFIRELADTRCRTAKENDSRVDFCSVERTFMQKSMSCCESNNDGCIVCETVLAAVTFAILPFAAGLASVSVWKLALCGGIVFAVLNAAFNGMTKRMELADVQKGAAIPAAFVLYLACQRFTNILL